MSLSQRIAAHRAASSGSAASSQPRSVLVVGDSPSHTPAAVRETLYSGPVERTAFELLDRDDYHVVNGRIVRRVPMSPFTRAALSGSLPTHRDLPEEA